MNHWTAYNSEKPLKIDPQTSETYSEADINLGELTQLLNSEDSELTIYDDCFPPDWQDWRDIYAIINSAEYAENMEAYKNGIL